MSDEEKEAWQGVTGPLKAIAANSLIGSAMMAKRPYSPVRYSRR